MCCRLTVLQVCINDGDSLLEEDGDVRGVLCASEGMVCLSTRPLLPSQPPCCSHTPCTYPSATLPQPLCCHYSHSPCTLNKPVPSGYEHATSQVREIKSQLPEADIMFLEM